LKVGILNDRLAKPLRVNLSAGFHRNTSEGMKALLKAEDRSFPLMKESRTPRYKAEAEASKESFPKITEAQLQEEKRPG
jgi:hypothetical protein